MPLNWTDLIDLSGIKDAQFARQIEEVLDFRFSRPDGQDKLTELKEKLDHLERERHAETGGNILFVPLQSDDYKVKFIQEANELSYTDYYGRAEVTLDPEMIKRTAYIDKDFNVVALTLNRVIEHELLEHSLEDFSKMRDFSSELSNIMSRKLADLKTVVRDNPHNTSEAIEDYIEIRKELSGINEALKYYTDILTEEQILHARDRQSHLENTKHSIENLVTQVFSVSPAHEDNPSVNAFLDYVSARDAHRENNLHHTENSAVTGGNVLESEFGIPDRGHYHSTITLSKPQDEILYYASEEQAKTLEVLLNEPLSESEERRYKRLNQSKDDDEVAKHSPEESIKTVTQELVKDNPRLKEDILNAASRILNPIPAGAKTEEQARRESDIPTLPKATSFER